MSLGYPHLPISTSNSNSSGGQEKSSLFRSETMSLVQLYIPSELAHSAVCELGELGLIQFRNMNPDLNSFQRTFVAEIRRLDEMERRFRFFKQQCTLVGVPVKKFESLTGHVSPRIRSLQECDDLDALLLDLESKLLQMNASFEGLSKRFSEMVELRHVLSETAFFFDQAENKQDEYEKSGYASEDPDSPLLDVESSVGLVQPSSSAVNISFVAGIIHRDKMPTFERILWRALRGNLFLRFAEIDEPLLDPVTHETILKNVFVVFAHGDQLLNKIRRISESLGGTVFSLDGSPRKRSEDLLEVTARLEDLGNVIFNTEATRKAELVKISMTLDQWSIMIKKEKGIYHTMNSFNFDSTRKCLIAEGWCPSSSINTIQYALNSTSERSGAMVHPIVNEMRTTLTHPTYHKVNKYTSAFQSIVDAYGMARYKEVNPGIFTLITFPFLFAVMFGDFGHGFLLACFAAYLIMYEKTILTPETGEITRTIFGGRYIIILMGLFSIYTGLIYNDIFSLPVYLTESSFEVDPHSTTTLVKMHATYPLGMDPKWRECENSLLFLNSFKMKMSIIMGVIHMSFGICLGVWNHRYFKKPINIYCEFIPQLTFLLCIFGYLCILIIYKWLHLHTWGGSVYTEGAPALLQTLIYMFLKAGTVEPRSLLYTGQEAVQTFLVLLALCCVPWMLCVKPYLLWKEHKDKAEGYLNVNADSPTAPSNNSDVSAAHNLEMHGEKFEFSEVIIHQVIHTIEFCLGAISNTASYLRLWALSLAHAQLSEVLWDMTMKSTITGNPVTLILGYFFWFVLTIGILISMEGLSAFLHALRLHWVEFNGKFYEGTGIPFEPFSFEIMLEEDAIANADG